MNTSNVPSICLSFILALCLSGLSACQPAETTPSDALTGVVTGPNGPEAGVWVIAETQDLPTKYVKIVVTNDDGRYAIPELPNATYDVWVRGYGLVDSPKVQATPGQNLDLTAVEAPNEQAAAEYYPAGYWFSLLQPPDKSEFPGTGPEGNGFNPSLTTRANFLRNIKSGNCMACHQLGSQGTRKIPESLMAHETSSVEAWARRLQSGQAGGQMIRSVETTSWR